MLEPYSSDFIWLVVLGFVISFILAFGIGANDVANSFGTSVGSKVLTLFKACCMATVFEIAGSILIGYKVSDTMRKGILDVNVYENSEIELMLGCLSTLIGSAIWLIAATFLKMPISGTHSIVGATVGFSLVARGFSGLHWYTLGMIVASWFISPVLSGLTSVTILLIIRYGILKRPDPVQAGLVSLPLFYGFTVFLNVFSIVHNGPKLLHMDGIPSWLAAVISFIFGIVTMIVIQFFVIPWQRKQLELESCKRTVGINFNIGESSDTSAESSPRTSKRNSQLQDRHLTVIAENTEMLQVDNNVGTDKSTTKYTFPSLPDDNKNGYTAANELKTKENAIELNTSKSAATLSNETNAILSPSSSGAPLIKNKSFAKSERGKDEPQLTFKETNFESENESVSKLFSFLQILTASFGSFAHGGNDVSNAIGPLIALWLIYSEGSVQQKSETPLYILLFGGAGISVGLWVWGRRVIKTIGEDLTKITASTGFTIEVGASLTVLLASKIGLPISTTHCKVGSVVFVGYFNTTQKGVDWKLFRNIIYAWLVTVPAAGLLSAGCMFIFNCIVL